MPRATIVLPTHDHGPTLGPTLRSVLGQTERDIEVVVVGDGVPEITRTLVTAVAANDPRLRFLDHPKGAAKGEAWRDAAVRSAGAPVVLYASDDDLWFPDHVERMLALLDGHDFAHCRATLILPDGRARAFPTDFTRPAHRRHVLRGRPPALPLPPPCVAHTVEAYRRLPHGWRPAPAGVPTDVHMWRQVFAVEGLRWNSGRFATHLTFASPYRKGVPIEDRVAELETWEPRLLDPAWRERFERGLLEDVESRCLDLQEQLLAIHGSAAWRLRDGLLRVPVIGAALRGAARLAAGR